MRAWLSNRGYPSLYRFYDLITEAWVYGILFGPLALVNTAVGLTFGFIHLNLDGVGALPTALEKSLKTLVTEFLLFFDNIDYQLRMLMKTRMVTFTSLFKWTSTVYHHHQSLQLPRFDRFC